MNNPPTLEDSIALAVSMHDGQKDKSDQPYILHLCRVMISFAEPLLQTIGVLHDILEDTEMTSKTLTALGYERKVVETVLVLTRPEGSSYSAYIDQCLAHPLARKVKIADLEDHLRNVNSGNLSHEQIVRYMKAYHQLCGFWPRFCKP